MNDETYRERLTDLQVEVEELRAKLKESQTGDLISRAAAIDAICCLTCDTREGCELHPCIEVRQLINLPSAQPEIIRCKDCTHRNGDYCHRFHDGYSAFICREDYCSYAESREE